MTIDEVELSTREYLEELIRLNKLAKSNKKIAFLMGYLNESGFDGSLSAEPKDVIKRFIDDMAVLSGMV